MKKSALAAALAIAALSLSGCAGGTSTPDAAETSAASAPVAIGATSAPATEATPSEMPTTSPEPTTTTSAEPTSMFKSGQAWADDAYDSWFEGMQYTYIEDPDAAMCPAFDDLKGYRDCLPSDPNAYIKSFTSTEPGHLVVTLTPDSRWQGGEYDADGSGLPFVAGNIGPRLQQDGFPFLKVTAKIAGTDKSYTYEMFPSDSPRDHKGA